MAKNPPQAARKDAGFTLCVVVALGCAHAAGCAETIPQGAYGVSSIEIRGTDHVDDEAIKACLATHPRERFGWNFGSTGDPVCGVPPFDASRAPVRLWAWPWTDWPLYREAVFRRDRERIERFYRARGYYDARVAEALVVRDEDERDVEISVRVEEGEPVLVIHISVEGLEALPPEVQAEARNAIALERGAPFDEALFDRSKLALRDALFEASYAKATVEGRVEVDPEQKTARVFFAVTPGPPCRFGDVIIPGNSSLSKRLMLRAAALERDTPFSLSALDDAKRAVFDLGPFATIELEPHPRPDSAVVDTLIRFVPARRFRVGVGVGMEIGGPYAQEADANSNSFAQWDVHLLGKLEHKNFLGGMRRLRIEERPRFIFDDRFPGVNQGQPGNLLIVELRQPAFIEPRMTLVGKTRWDRGPDPYGGRFLRHDVIVSVGPERYFFDGLLRWSSTLGGDLLLPDGEDPFPHTEAFFFDHTARLDLRDDPNDTHSGTYFGLGLQHAGTVLPSDWTYVRITQDNRGYLPLPGGLVLAGRARFGFMYVFNTDIAVPSPPPEGDQSDQAVAARQRFLFLDNLSRYGPLRQRLRGGGQNSVRGYEPNQLGDAQIVDSRLLSGGLRQWEASLELRVPITESFRAAVFADVGDVSQSKDYRFDYPQTSFGLGLRYHPPFSLPPVRFDVAFAPPALQVIGEDKRNRSGLTAPDFFGAAGTWHFTIGEAY